MNRTKEFIIYGCGGHSRSIADVILYNNPKSVITFVDSNARKNEKIFCFDVVKTISIKERVRSIVALGDNYKRKRKFDVVNKKYIISVISKRSYMGLHCKIQKGCFIGHGSYVGPGAVIGYNTVINTSSIVEHEVVIGNHCHIAPHSTICGRADIGDLVLIGAGAVILDNISICSHTIIGAGATVIKNIHDPGIYAGTPAKKIGENHCELI